MMETMRGILGGVVVPLVVGAVVVRAVVPVLIIILWSMRRKRMGRITMAAMIGTIVLGFAVAMIMTMAAITS